MVQEDKDLLLRDLCARLPFGVRVKSSRRRMPVTLSLDVMTDFHLGCSIKPFLRPSSSITEDEKRECKDYLHSIEGALIGNMGRAIWFFDWLNAHHFDYRGLINDGLALEALKGMYKN